ncbi:MAG: hemolysin family protein [Alteraurantiacibacter sp.]
MDPFPWHYLAALAGLIVINGVFAMSELAIVSARAAQLRVAAQNGSKSAEIALKLAEEPGKFLSTVQIGITLIGIIAGAVSGATLGEPLGQQLAVWGVEADLADNLGFIIMIGLTTYFSLVVGELVPKQLALRAAMPIALVMARPMAMLARITAPIVWLLDTSSNAIMRLIGLSHRGEHGMSAEELHMVFADASRSGVIAEQERDMLSGIMRLADKPVRELMTPRTELDWIDAAADEDELWAEIEATPHSLLPVADGSPDKVLGVVKVRDILAARLAGQLTGKPVVLADLIKKAEVVPDQLDALDALRLLQQSGISMAMVHDEYGHLDGVVTTADILAAIAGSFASHQDDDDEPKVVRRDDGSMLVAGSLPADALAECLEISLPEQREYATAAGFVLFQMKKLPGTGEWFEHQGWRFEVVDLDGRRIDKLLVSKAD